MRLERFPPASAIVLILLAAVGPGAVASSSPVASVEDADGTVAHGDPIRVVYSGYSHFAHNVSGYLTLDGEPAGTFVLAWVPPGQTTFDVTLDAPSATSGVHALGARVFTSHDPPVDAAPISVVFDKPPTISDVSAAYDLDAKLLRIEATVLDDRGASLVRFDTPSANGTYIVNGTIEVALPAPRAVGVYHASIAATDGWNHTSRHAFSYEVVDREATIAILDARYVLGGRLALAADVADPDRLVRVVARTGFGTWDLERANGTWRLDAPIAPRLGTHEGTLETRDEANGTTNATFSFTIGGARETFYDEVVVTHTGAYADRTTLALPGLLDGRIEICVDACDEGTAVGERLETSGEADDWARGRAYGLVCSVPDNVHCRVLTGRAFLGGALEACSPRTTQNGNVHDAAMVVDSFARSALGHNAVCRDHWHESVEGADASTPALPRVEADHVAVVARYVSSGAEATCASTGGDISCLIQATGGTSVDLTWSQAQFRTVHVRMSGVRV